MSNAARDWVEMQAPMLLTNAGKPCTTSRAVLSVMAGHARDDGSNAFPGPALISWKTGFDLRTIDRAMKKLAAAGLIEATGRTRGGTVVYRLCMEVVRPASEWEEHLARIEAAKRVNADKAAQRRRTAATPTVGTQNPDDIDTRHADSVGDETDASGFEIPTDRESGFEIPTSGFNAPLTVKEPSEELTAIGGTLPPDPLRHPDPSGRGPHPQPSPSDELTTQPAFTVAPTDRAGASASGRAREIATVPRLALIDGEGQTDDGTRSLWPAPVAEATVRAAYASWSADSASTTHRDTPHASEAVQAARDAARAAQERAQALRPAAGHGR